MAGVEVRVVLLVIAGHAAGIAGDHGVLVRLLAGQGGGGAVVVPEGGARAVAEDDGGAAHAVGAGAAADLPVSPGAHNRLAGVVQHPVDDRHRLLFVVV